MARRSTFFVQKIESVSLSVVSVLSVRNSKLNSKRSFSDE